jgi:predicted nucleic acid-binding protein
MRVFWDTSAAYALLDANDIMHSRCVATWQRLRQDRTQMVSSSYVLLETYALCQRRLGVAAVNDLSQRLEALTEVVWVTPTQHRVGVEALISSNRRDLSLVDCTSFLIMREQQIAHVFTLDPHFEEQGFASV